MFDKLIESDSASANFKPRRSYFIVSSFVMGILFITAVVISIYAGEIIAPEDDWDLTRVVAPVEIVPPPQVQPQQTSTRKASSSLVPTRPSNMLRTDEPPVVPDSISVTPNTELARPKGPFAISLGPPGDAAGGDAVTRSGGEAVAATGLSTVASEPASSVVSAPGPPPLRPAKAVEKQVVKSLGVINGIAITLPKPGYSPAAIAMKVTGNVDVQVTIDETGKVISAKAVSGHPMLRSEAERAAWRARFTPTKLSNVPVKVTGIIVYRFTRG